MKSIFLILFFVPVFVHATTLPLVGGDRDVHGCI